MHKSDTIRPQDIYELFNLEPTNAKISEHLRASRVGGGNIQQSQLKDFIQDMFGGNKNVNLNSAIKQMSKNIGLKQNISLKQGGLESMDSMKIAQTVKWMENVLFGNQIASNEAAVKRYNEVYKHNKVFKFFFYVFYNFQFNRTSIVIRRLIRISMTISLLQLLDLRSVKVDDFRGSILYLITEFKKYSLESAGSLILPGIYDSANQSLTEFFNKSNGYSPMNQSMSLMQCYKIPIEQAFYQSVPILCQILRAGDFSQKSFEQQLDLYKLLHYSYYSGQYSDFYPFKNPQTLDKTIRILLAEEGKQDSDEKRIWKYRINHESWKQVSMSVIVYVLFQIYSVFKFPTALSTYITPERIKNTILRQISNRLAICYTKYYEELYKQYWKEEAAHMDLLKQIYQEYKLDDQTQLESPDMKIAQEKIYKIILESGKKDFEQYVGSIWSKCDELAKVYIISQLIRTMLKTFGDNVYIEDNKLKYRQNCSYAVVAGKFIAAYYSMKIFTKKEEYKKAGISIQYDFVDGKDPVVHPIIHGLVVPPIPELNILPSTIKDITHNFVQCLYKDFIRQYEAVYTIQSGDVIDPQRLIASMDRVWRMIGKVTPNIFTDATRGLSSIASIPNEMMAKAVGFIHNPSNCHDDLKSSSDKKDKDKGFFNKLGDAFKDLVDYNGGGNGYYGGSAKLHFNADLDLENLQRLDEKTGGLINMFMMNGGGFGDLLKVREQLKSAKITAGADGTSLDVQGLEPQAVKSIMSLMDKLGGTIKAIQSASLDFKDSGLQSTLNDASKQCDFNNPESIKSRLIIEPLKSLGQMYCKKLGGKAEFVREMPPEIFYNLTELNLQRPAEIIKEHLEKKCGGGLMDFFSGAFNSLVQTITNQFSSSEGTEDNSNSPHLGDTLE